MIPITPVPPFHEPRNAWPLIPATEPRLNAVGPDREVMLTSL
jgi:hypothetical protein